MTINTQRPTGVDVTVFNPKDVIYIKGDEFTDGSLRYFVVLVNGELVCEIEERINGIFQPTSFKTGPNSVLVGTLVGLSAAGRHLISRTSDDNVDFFASSDFKDGVTTRLANILNATGFFERVIFRPDESGSFTGKSIETLDTDSPVHLITSAFYFKTDATAASQPVRVQSWSGLDDTGILIFDQTYPASDFPANTEIRLTLEGFLEFDFGDNTFTRISSAANFSLRTNLAGTVWWLAVDFSSIKDDDLLQTVEYVSGDNFTLGDWSIQDRKVFEANLTGPQTGTFDDNIDKWDKLISIQGFDRILTSLDANIIANNNGNLLVGSAA